MQTINTTAAFIAQLDTIRAAGKTPWVILNDDYAVGAYAGRTEAREAKAEQQLAGKILKADEVKFEVVTLAQAAQALHDGVNAAVITFEVTASAIQTAANTALKERPVAPIGADLDLDPHAYACPHCGVHLENGVGVHKQEVNGKLVDHDEFEYECLACGGEFGPAISIKKVKPVVVETEAAQVRVVTNTSTVTRPCKLVWSIADQMKVTNPGAKRKDILTECVKQGVAFYTARTQYQQWLTVQHEMAVRPTAVLGKK